MERQNYIGLDLGTSEIKGVLMDDNDNVIAEFSKSTTFLDLNNDYIEINPEEHYRIVCSVIKELSSKSSVAISAIAMSGASGNTLLTDDKGVPLTNIISWMDKRCQSNRPKILNKITKEKMHQVVGWSCVDTFPFAHLAWLKENESDTFNNAGHYCMNTDWLIFKLTNQWVMDYSTATTFHLHDQEKKQYNNKLLKLLNIEESKLSRLVESGINIGLLTPQAIKDTHLNSSTKVITGCFDHPSAARGIGINADKQLMLSCGTSWVGFFAESNRQKIIDNNLLCDPFSNSKDGLWGAMFSISEIGKKIEWYIDNLIAPNSENKYEEFNKLASLANFGADGLDIEMNKEPQKINARKEHIAKAVMEGTVNLLNHKLKLLKEKNIVFSELTIVGGASESSMWRKTIEKKTSLKVIVESKNAGAKGAALLAKKGIIL